MKIFDSVASLVMAIFIFACASSPPLPVSDTATSASVRQSGVENNSDQPLPNDHNEEQLAALWAARNGKQAKFSIESGDVLHVSVPRLEELQERTVRVDEQGNISLPLLGSVHAAGLSEDDLRQELMKRAGEYMYHPQVDLFVTSYSSRQAGVLGEVPTPGMYTVHGPADTIRQMIQRAGGVNENGAREVLLMPPGTNTTPSNPATSQYVSNSAQASGPVSNADSTGIQAIALGQGAGGPQGTIAPLVISLIPRGPNERFLDLPVIPGDTLIVPHAGDVTVTGWVYTPKTIPITPGLTILGAISAAGGPMFAADKNAVELIRQDGNGHVTVRKVDLDRIKNHQSPDVEVQANDVVQVSYSTARIPAYAAYYVLQSFASFGPMALISGGL